LRNPGFELRCETQQVLDLSQVKMLPESLWSSSVLKPRKKSQLESVFRLFPSLAILRLRLKKTTGYRRTRGEERPMGTNLYVRF